MVAWEGLFGASGSRYRSYLAFGFLFLLQPLLHKQVGPSRSRAGVMLQAHKPLKTRFYFA